MARIRACAHWLQPAGASAPVDFSNEGCGPEPGRGARHIGTLHGHTRYLYFKEAIKA